MVKSRQSGFTLIELMIVVAIIGVLAAITYPSYKQYVIRTHRADAMTELQNIANQLESKKMLLGNYGNIPATTITALGGNFPRSGGADYTIAISIPDATSWSITATPVSGGLMVNDGNLTLNSNGIKCRDTACGTGDEWRN